MNIDHFLNEHAIKFFTNLDPESLIEKSIELKEGSLSNQGALCIDTGEFTGRSPKDRFIVKDPLSEKTVNWSTINTPLSIEHYQGILEKMLAYMVGKSFFRRNASACADPSWTMELDIITEHAFQDLFSSNLFLPSKEIDNQNQGKNLNSISSGTKMGNKLSNWMIIALPNFKADPSLDGTRGKNFTIINFSEHIVIIGGTAYTGEIKKSVFSILNYLLPQNGVLSMHCSTNIGIEGDSALFFGLSGTGKTTLSADPERKLVGDDEHGWGERTVFNFEGGCYAKCISLTEEKEPQIFRAIKKGTLLENTCFKNNTNEVDYESTLKTENTRAAYPLRYIENAVIPSIAGIPKHIFFLTADAFGVLPPVAYLTVPQAIYHFLSGYTAKVAGTEAGVLEPQVTFSACFGNAFLTLHPTRYASMLAEKLEKHHLRVWLINTGWIAGGYGVGYRIPLAQTRAMVKSILNNTIESSNFERSPLFGFEVPKKIEGVHSEYLQTGFGWNDKNLFHQKLDNLAERFKDNFAQYETFVGSEVNSAAPKI